MRASRSARWVGTPVVALILLVRLAVVGRWRAPTSSRRGRWPGPTSSERDRRPPARSAQSSTTSTLPRHFGWHASRHRRIHRKTQDSPSPRHLRTTPTASDRRPCFDRYRSGVLVFLLSEPMTPCPDRPTARAGRHRLPVGAGPESLRSAWASRLPSKTRRSAALTPAELRLERHLWAACSRPRAR
jgi:hypothetical protein